MFKAERKAKKQFRDTGGAAMLSNESMVSFLCELTSLDCRRGHLSTSMNVHIMFHSAMCI